MESSIGSTAPRLEPIIDAYRSLIVRLYVRGRFHILRSRFLEEIGQYIPRRGRVLDIGCGFGLFALYFAKLRPEVTIEGFDYNARRIDDANEAARTLGRSNARFRCGDATKVSVIGTYDAVYMLDIVHHVPRAAVDPLILAIKRHLKPGGTLLIKDVADKPAYKRWFTWALDKAMDPRTPVSYWSPAELQRLLERHGFTVYQHRMVDYLPYPHVLYICHAEGA
jgi:2-polyprenyl-3-methyl-5-hydroxy-6-metoxy-1,4-benzoquinol methylase